ncbi:MAG: SDR family NAD(P)-dependent oxidoreductase [Spirochaetales bacterium]|nr:SDR family NAD(P)-dependent oxidoreductase [Leptospiraceae bacterium]MCP5482307.1 SDR family NAD(P)-dependent oxidoreductase [Spirochaetales bacterium]MCP5484254.1 SDR family NAD(P)-dependent oxidoreductase [Spirochaetales bacterium]
MKLTGNTVLITGGSSGIGLELAGRFIKSGNKVIITGRDANKLKQAKVHLGSVLVTIKSDVGRPGDVDSLYKKISKDFGNLNVLINNAGIMRTINLHNHKDKPEQLTKELDIDLKGPIGMVDRFLPLLKKNPDPVIVNVSSGLAFVPLPISPIYCAAKAALHSYTLSLRVQLQSAGIRVFELAPPATRTELLGEFSEDDMKGVSIMPLADMVDVAMKGFEKDDFEIRPGQANQLHFMSRLAPDFILKQMSKPVERLLASS